MSSHVRRIVVNRDALVASVLAHFRSAVGEHPGDPRFRELIETLQVESAEFRTLWTDFAVAESMAGPLTVVHPRLGLIHLHITGISAYATTRH